QGGVVLRAPSGALPPELLDALRAAKREITARLRAPSAAPARAPVTTPAPPVDRVCEHVGVEERDARWRQVDARPTDVHVSACTCCAGPALLDDQETRQWIALPHCSRCDQ